MNRHEFFNLAAQGWDDRFKTEKLLSFLKQLVPQFGIKTGQSVLDVGAGTGILIPFLLKEVGPSGRITAIDFAENTIEECTKKVLEISKCHFESSIG